MSHVHVMDHPLIQHKVSLMRDKETGPKEFRELLNEISMLMAYEVTRDLPLKTVQIETPICRAQTKVIAGKKLAIVPILRAGLGMVDGIMSLVHDEDQGGAHAAGHGQPRRCQQQGQGAGNGGDHQQQCRQLHRAPRYG